MEYKHAFGPFIVSAVYLDHSGRKSLTFCCPDNRLSGFSATIADTCSSDQEFSQHDISNRKTLAQAIAGLRDELPQFGAQQLSQCPRWVHTETGFDQ